MNLLKYFVVVFPLLLACNSGKETVTSQASPPKQKITTVIPNKSDKVKLVVGVTVDQMRFDYITRFWDDFGNDGFKRIINEGFNCKQNHYPYAPTYTGPGHAAIFSGTTPTFHGIIGNNWYRRDLKREVYCTEDSLAQGVGYYGPGSQMSPRNLKVTNLGDQIKLATQFKGKVIGVSLKDRGAILPAGRGADAAYWWIGKDMGHWITSNYYMDKVPEWVKLYNRSDAAEKMLASQWQLLKPLETYDESTADNTPFESPFKGKLQPSFPYDLQALSEQNGGFDVLKSTPYGNKIVLDFAKLVIENEGLGQDDHTDLLTVSFSSPDYVGHQFGPQSMEAQDLFLRLDQDLGELMKHLDETVGKGEYILFLSADHGAAQVPSYLQAHKMAPDYWNPAPLEEKIEQVLDEKFGTGDYLEKYSNDQIFLNHKTIERKNLDLKEVSDLVVNVCIEFDGIAKAITGIDLASHHFSDGIFSKLQMGYSQKSSGDVVLLLEPGWISYGRQGTTHGSAYPYDTHVPFLITGRGVNHGETYEATHVTDIVPTVCAILGIQAPNACVGRVVPQIIAHD